MTPLAGRNPVVRESSVMIRDGGKPRELIVALHPEFITLRLKGTRREEIVHLESAFFGAVKARVFRDRMDKAKARKEKAERSKAMRSFLTKKRSRT
jgi:hypothetical protein